MPTLNLTNEQVIELIKQLPIQQQGEIFRFLLLQQWENWEALSSYGHDKIQLIAQQRGYNWDEMTEEEKESLIDEIVHEK
jgi:hypothetical protein